MEPVSRPLGFPVLIVYRTRAFTFRVARIASATFADLARFTEQNIGRDLTAVMDIDLVRAEVARWCDSWIATHGDEQ